MPNVQFGRRQALKGIGAGLAAWCASPFAAHGADAPPAAGDIVSTASRKRVARIAHITDVHVQPELAANEGLAACLRHLQGQKDKPDVIFNTGDSIMDSMSKDASRTALQWGIWRDVLKAECGLPIEHCIGNHDIWGWNKSKSKTAGNEALWGKRRALDAFGLDKPYRSYDRFGWHFVVLDSVQPFKNAYRGGLDDEQFAWLQSDLAAVPQGKPVLVMSHVPIISAAAFFNEVKPKKTSAKVAATDGAAGGDAQVAEGEAQTAAAKEKMKDKAAPARDAGDAASYTLPAARVFLDARRVSSLFAERGNVKACISGHIHEIDEVRYQGTTYLCNGAVSGNWWKGRKGQCGPGYTLIDLFDDGSFDSHYVEYGWTPRA